MNSSIVRVSPGVIPAIGLRADLVVLEVGAEYEYETGDQIADAMPEERIAPAERDGRRAIRRAPSKWSASRHCGIA